MMIMTMLMIIVIIIIIIIIIIQFNYSLTFNYKVRAGRMKQQTKSRQALITNKVSQLTTITDQPSTSSLATPYETVQY